MIELLGARIRPDHADGGSAGGRTPGWIAAALAAGLAVAVAVVGLLATTVAVLVVQTLDPEGGLPLSASTAVAGRLWVLAQGGSVELTSGPLVLAPLLMTLAVAWGLAQAGRWLVRAAAVGASALAVRSAAVLVAVHTAIVLVLALVLAGSGAGVLRAGAGALVVASVAAGWGVGRESGLLEAALARLPGAVRPVLRGAWAGGLTLAALCCAVVAVAVASDVEGYAALSTSLGGAGAGALGLLTLGVLLLPNAALAALGLAAGPGFAVGTGTVVSVSGVTLGAVPALPLLAALPDTQAVPLLAFVSQVVPVLAGLVAGVTVGRHLGPGDGGSLLAGLWGAASGVVLGVLAIAAAWAGGGALGNGDLSVIGAPPVATGLAVAVQVGLAAVPAAAVARWRSPR